MKIAKKIAWYLFLALDGLSALVVMWRLVVWHVWVPYRMLPLVGIIFSGYALLFLYSRYAERARRNRAKANTADTGHRILDTATPIISKSDTAPVAPSKQNMLNPAQPMPSIKEKMNIEGRRSFLKTLSNVVSIFLKGSTGAK